MSLSLVVNPFRFSQKPVLVPFRGKKEDKNTLPPVDVKTPKKMNPVELPGVSYFMASKIIESSNKFGISVDDFLRQYLKHLTFVPQVLPEPSKTAQVGKTNVTTLIDGGQIFDKTIEYIKSAEKSIQVEMFEFQNLKVDGHKWPANGAEVTPGFEEQKSILPILISKKKENPNLKVQVILDAHKWYMNGNGEKDRHYNNQDMIKYLKENGIDVVPYPRAAQNGAALQHVKMLAVDGKKVIMGGMNWGTHSCANHDACVAIETQTKYKNSEVDNIIEDIFNTDWKFAWQRLGKTKLVAGPLSEEEQDAYSGMRKEIKQENVDYMNVVGAIYNKPEYLHRYDPADLSKLDLIKTQPIENPKIKVLATKPNELKYVGGEGKETTRKYLQDKLNTASKVRGELFVLSDKELIQTIVKRTKSGDLDAKFIVSSDILEEFPYCRKAYNELVANDVPVRLYNFDEKINQRMHGKWAVFDDKEILIGSTNWSAMGLNQNLDKGKREDYELFAEKINEEIKEYLTKVKEFEDELGLPPLSRQHLDYKELLARRALLKQTINSLNKFGAAQVEMEGQKYNFTDEQKSTLCTVQGYYKIIKDRENAKEKYKRGNNECAIAFEKPSLANVFTKQFDKDWNHSVSNFDVLKDKVLQLQGEPSSNLDIIG
ncbi:MAG: phospholipase D-like domain-containing protein [Candidatus Gastranaerophilales bacterium]|nr:phospholipase D-like domain-containing protein [Candidatus Gastranaerophilales bacterium]